MSAPKWIEFHEVPKPAERRTRHWMVHSKQSGDVLGTIAWYTNWRKYCWFPYPDTVFEWQCLRDIAEFIERETLWHREQAKEREAGK